jgi:hypothetical protein
MGSLCRTHARRWQATAASLERRLLEYFAARVHQRQPMPDEELIAQTSQPPEGRYANYFEVGHNAFEFVLDFGQQYPGNPDAQIHSRIITAPPYVKALLATLTASLSRYESHFGPIPEPTDASSADDGL